MRSPCIYPSVCEFVDRDKVFSEPCVSCELIARWQAKLFTLGVSDLPDFSSDREPPAKQQVPAIKKVKIPKRYCISCKIVSVRRGQTECAKCRKRKQPCSDCGKIGVYAVGRCLVCHRIHVVSNSKEYCSICGDLGVYLKGFCVKCYCKEQKRKLKEAA